MEAYRPLYYEVDVEKLRHVPPPPQDPALPVGAGITPDRKCYFWQRECTLCGGPVYVCVDTKWYDADKLRGWDAVLSQFARWDGLGCDACSDACKEDVAASLAAARYQQVWIDRRTGLRTRTPDPDAGVRQVPPRTPPASTRLR